MSYNGWKNYETWLVNLWLTNDEYSDSVLREYANTDDVTSLQDYVTELVGGYGSAGLGTDLLNSALSEVDWQEIIDNHKEDSE